MQQNCNKKQQFLDAQDAHKPNPRISQRLNPHADMDSDGGGDGRADTLHHGLTHRQRHQRRQHGERVVLWRRHAGDGFLVTGLRHSCGTLRGLRLIGLCRQPP